MTAASERVRVRRGPHKARYDRATIDAILDRGLLCHVAFAVDGDAYCVPMLYARVVDTVYIHGSAASRALRALANGASACLTVTVVDGLVLARSAFEHSTNYESVMVFGRFTNVAELAERMVALEAFTEKLLPGRWNEVRGPSERELKATAILSMPIDEASAKRRTGPPDDDDSPDAALDTWAGVVPIEASFGEPVSSPGLRPGIPLSASLRRLLSP
jgi:nitroimidazol reductase NimA-like FMN-containing flavoprotein (pyridoxamine 5'-phosphate oxidase superfamily)